MDFFQKDFSITDRTSIILLDLEFREFKEAKAVRTYSRFKETFSEERFDFILIDRPLGGDMEQYSRIDMLELIPECLEDNFVIMIDDVERSGEKNTVIDMCDRLELSGIAFSIGYYNGQKSTAMLCSNSLSFLTSM